MNTNYSLKIAVSPRLIMAALLVFTVGCMGLSSFAQQNGTTKVANDRQLIDAAENSDVTSMMIEAGFYISIDRYLGQGIKACKKVDPETDSPSNCIYAIQQADRCFDPVAPATTVCDSARVFTFDPTNCGCCPPNDAGTWSYVSGPGNVTFSSLTEDSTEFCVDQPGSYLLRYTWPAPWNSQVETEYIFYAPFNAVLSVEADEVCALSTTVHLEYNSTFPDPNTTLTWTLNGEPYAGPAYDPDGVSLDFDLTVPSCGIWVLEVTLASPNCGAASASVTILFKGNAPPVITGVGADTTTICPDMPVFSEPEVSDPCDPNPVLTYETDSIPGDCEHSYTLIRIWTATNWCGEMAVDTQIIIHLPNPNPEILLGFQTDELGDTIFANCDDEVIIPFPEIMTTCGPAEVFFTRSDGGDWGDPFEPGTTTEVCYWGISPCGFSTDTICFPVIVEACEQEGEQFCTLTQGYYGNPGGTFCNGMGTAELIDFLLAQGPLVVGSAGNTMTFQPGESGCVIDLLPGSGPAKKINGANTCASHPGIQKKNGRIFNILLSQTITLGLNLRLSGDLGNLQIFSDTLETAPSSGCDGEGDTITGPYTKYAIPASVYNVLSVGGTITPTVYDLYALANTGLGGGAVGATTLSAISEAVDRINVGFDECAFGAFQLQPVTQAVQIQGGSVPAVYVTSLDMKIFPNPFNTSANIELIAPEDGHATVEIYTLTGARVAVLYDGQVEAGRKYQYAFAGDPGMDQVTYICVIRTDRETRFERMVMIR